MKIKLIDILLEEVTESQLLPSPIGPTHETSPFGSRSIGGVRGQHNGIDLRSPVGTQILNPASGRVITAKKVDETWDEVLIRTNNNPNGNDRCGSRVVIEHTSGILNGLKTIYCHLSEINVGEGDVIEEGQLIGLTGGKRNSKGSGRTIGPHLHLGVKNNNEPLNPKNYFSFKRGGLGVSSVQSNSTNTGTTKSSPIIPSEYIKNNLKKKAIGKNKVEVNNQLKDLKNYLFYDIKCARAFPVIYVQWEPNPQNEPERVVLFGDLQDGTPYQVIPVEKRGGEWGFIDSSVGEWQEFSESNWCTNKYRLK